MSIAGFLKSGEERGKLGRSLTSRKTHKTNEAVLDKQRWTSSAAREEEDPAAAGRGARPGGRRGPSGAPRCPNTPNERNNTKETQKDWEKHERKRTKENKDFQTSPPLPPRRCASKTTADLISTLNCFKQMNKLIRQRT